MGRLKPEFLERVESLCHRVVDVAEALQRQRRSARLIDQIIAAGTSVGANAFEADEAMTRAEFVRCLVIATRELNETRFWMRIVGHRNWITQRRLGPIEQECGELKRIFGTMIARSRPAKKAPR